MKNHPGLADINATAEDLREAEYSEEDIRNCGAYKKAYYAAERFHTEKIILDWVIKECSK